MPAKVELFDALDAVERDAAGMLDRAQQPLLFDRLDWFRLTLAHCPPPGKLLVARARDGEARVWLFLMVEGGRARALASWYALEVGTQHHAADAGTADCLEAIARRLARAGIDRIDLAPVARKGLRSAFAHAGWWVRAEQTGWNWSIAVTPGDWEGYWASRPATIRNTWRRKAARAALEIEIFNKFNAVAWDSYDSIYQASWKPAEGSPAFLRALAEQEGAAGTLRLGIARRNGAPVAAQFWLTEIGIATIHKLAHTSAADALSPGTILSAAMFRHAIEVDHVHRIDFGTGDERYKADWMDTRRPLHTLTAWNRKRWRSWIGAARALVGRFVSR